MENLGRTGICVEAPEREAAATGLGVIRDLEFWDSVFRDQGFE